MWAQAVKRVRFRGRKEESSDLRAANVFVHLFIVAVLGFLLPFVTFSCSGQRLATVTGVQLVTGVEAGGHRSPSDARAAFALGMCVLGVLLSLKGTRPWGLWSRCTATADRIGCGREMKSACTTATRWQLNT